MVHFVHLLFQSSSSTNHLCLYPTVGSFTKAKQALHTSAPSTIFCREKELAAIGDFLQPLIDNKKPGSMYISGRPGTGKTACITYTLANRKVINQHSLKCTKRTSKLTSF